MNLAIITGNVGKAEVKTTANGTQYISGSVATTEAYKKDNDWVKQTTWHNVKIWKPSEYVKNNFVSGNKVSISGRIENTEHEGKYYSSIVADRVEITPKNQNTTQDSSPGYAPETETDLPF